MRFPPQKSHAARRLPLAGPGEDAAAGALLGGPQPRHRAHLQGGGVRRAGGVVVWSCAVGGRGREMALGFVKISAPERTSDPIQPN